MSLVWGLDESVTNAARNASHLHPTAITQLFLFETHSHGSKSFFLTNRSEQRSPLTWLFTWCTHISIPILGLESHSGIFLSQFSHGQPQAAVAPLLTWQRWSNWPRLLPTAPTPSHWEVVPRTGPDTAITSLTANPSVLSGGSENLKNFQISEKSIGFHCDV